MCGLHSVFDFVLIFDLFISSVFVGIKWSANAERRSNTSMAMASLTDGQNKYWINLRWHLLASHFHKQMTYLIFKTHKVFYDYAEIEWNTNEEGKKIAMYVSVCVCTGLDCSPYSTKHRHNSQQRKKQAFLRQEFSGEFTANEWL